LKAAAETTAATTAAAAAAKAARMLKAAVATVGRTITIVVNVACMVVAASSTENDWRRTARARTGETPGVAQHRLPFGSRLQQREASEVLGLK
jgi:enamine deaminase RidA (YjgF/YER057c/UK114 family)